MDQYDFILLMYMTRIGETRLKVCNNIEELCKVCIPIIDSFYERINSMDPTPSEYKKVQDLKTYVDCVGSSSKLVSKVTKMEDITVFIKHMISISDICSTNTAISFLSTIMTTKEVISDIILVKKGQYTVF